MIAKLADLDTRYLYLPSKGITIVIGGTTQGNGVSTSDATKILMAAESRVIGAYGNILKVYTRLAADCVADAPTLTVDSTAQFPAIGSFVLAGQRVTYTGKTANSFTGCTNAPAAYSGFFCVYDDYQLTTDDLGSQIPDRTVETALNKLLELIIMEAAYQIWRLRYPGDTAPEEIKQWRKEVDKAIYSQSFGMVYRSL